MNSFRTDNPISPSPADPTPVDYDTSHPLTALILNCQSLTAKKESFQNIICTHSPDVIFGTESWLKSTVKNSEVFPNGYVIYRQDRCDGYGGVFVACCDNLATHDVHLTASSCELVACHIQLTDHSSLIACSVYRPPSSNELYLAELCQQLATIQAQYPNSALWIAGDINLPDINWVNNCTTGHFYPLNLNNTFLDFLSDNALSQMVTTPTRGSNILDIFVTNRPSLVETCDTTDGISDHEAVLVVSSVLANLFHPSKRLIYLWAQADFNAIRGNMQSLCEDFLNKFSTLTPVDVLWDEFLSVCNMCMDSIPTKFTSSKCKHPWINNCIKRITRRKQRAYNQARRSNLATDWSKYYDLKENANVSVAQLLTDMYQTWLILTRTLLLNVYGPLLKTKDKIMSV